MPRRMANCDLGKDLSALCQRFGPALDHFLRPRIAWPQPYIARALDLPCTTMRPDKPLQVSCAAGAVSVWSLGGPRLFRDVR